MATGERRDPFRAFNFQLEIDNLAARRVQRVQRPDGRRRRGGLPRRHRPAAQRAQAGRPAQVHQHHAQARLHAGRTSLWDWYSNIVNGVADRRNVTIVLMNEERAAGAALARRERLDQQDRRAELQGQRQRSRDRVGRAGARRPDHRGLAYEDVRCAITANTGCLLRASRRQRAAIARCARTSPASSASPRAARCISRCPCSRGASFRPTSAISPARVILAYAVRAFFENGGRRCWVVRVASETAATAAVTLQSESLVRCLDDFSFESRSVGKRSGYRDPRNASSADVDNPTSTARRNIQRCSRPPDSAAPLMCGSHRDATRSTKSCRTSMP